MHFQRIATMFPFALMMIAASGCSGRIGDEVSRQDGFNGDGLEDGLDNGFNAGSMGGSDPRSRSPGDGTAGAPGRDSSAPGGAGGTGLASNQAGTAGSSPLPSNSGGAAGAIEAGAGTPDDTPPPGYVRAVAAVGYGGMRLLSRDAGKTWIKTAEVNPNGGDDRDLLRSFAYGKNLWVAGGWDKWWTSPDGATWTLRPHKYGIIQGLAYGNGVFVATSISGDVLRSVDGLVWTPAGSTGTGSHTRVVFGDGRFAASGDPGNSVTSVDGIKWDRFATPNVMAYCAAKLASKTTCWGDRFGAGFWIEGTWLRESAGQIQMGSDGKVWKSVFRLNSNSIEDFAFGWVAPSI